MTLDGDRDKRPRATDPSAVPAPRGRYLVFGASGYIGQHLVPRLLREDLLVRAVAGRRHPNELQVGDKVDSWTVLGVEREHRLTLKFGMKAPGSGVLELELSRRTGGGTRLTATGCWHPAGVWGLLHWDSLVPSPPDHLQRLDHRNLPARRGTGARPVSQMS